MKPEDDQTGDANTPKAPEYFESIDCTWWNAWAKGRQPHEFLIGVIKNIRDKQAVRYTNMKKCTSIYEWGFKSISYDSTDEQPMNEYTMCWKAASHAIDTVHSKVFKNKLVPMPITTGGGAIQRKRAEDLGKALDGLYGENNIKAIERDVGYDSLICGAGFAKTFIEFGRAKARFVPADDMTMDDAEGRYRSPRSIFESVRMDRYKVYEMYGADEDWLHGEAAIRQERILKCKEASNPGSSATSQDVIEVHEAYHLPSSPDAEDGRMCVVIDNCTLVDMPWKRPRFPYHSMIPMPRRRNSWGLSMMHALAAPQQEYEYVTRKLQKAHHKMGGGHFLAHEDSNVVERDLDNDQGTLVEWRGNVPPVEWTPNPASPQTYAYADSLPDKMLATFGISQMSARGEIPAGLQQASGKALQVFDDIEAEGLTPYHDARLAFHESLQQGFIDDMRDMLEREGLTEYKVRYTGAGKAFEMVDWKKVIMDEADFVLTLPTINQLSQGPSARFEQLQERLNAGLITPDQFKRLDGNPDIKSQNAIDTADEDIILLNLDIMVTEGRYLPPQPFDALDDYIRIAGKFYNLERAKKTPDDRLQLIRDALADAKSLRDQAMAAAAPPPAPGMPPLPTGGLQPPGAGDMTGGPPPGPPTMPQGMPPLPMAS